MSIVEITSLQHPGVEVYASLTEAQLRNSFDKERGLFIAESPKVINVALDKGYEPVSILCERRHIDGDAADIIKRCGDIPIYTGDRELLSDLTGYTLTRGVLCAMRRKPMPEVADVCRNASRIVVLDEVVEATNVGAIFRSAAALGIDAVLVNKSSCDPLNRRSIRVSMGSVFLVPWVRTDVGLRQLNRMGFRTVAMALTDNSVSIDDRLLMAEERLAIIMGNEGYGLPWSTIAEADYRVCIPMAHNVDSLNVAAAAAVAFWQLRLRNCSVD